MKNGTANHDIPSIKDHFKKKAIKALIDDHNYNGFLQLYMMHNYAEQLYSPDPCYRYSDIDMDFHRLIQWAVHSHPYSKQFLPIPHQPSPKLNLGIVLEGFGNNQTVIPRYRTLAKFHPRDRFSLFFYSRFSPEAPHFETDEYPLVIAELESLSCQVRFPSHSLSPINEIEFLARSITQDSIDILFFQTIYFVPQFNFLSCLHLAPFQSAASHQQPELSTELDCVEGPLSFRPYQVAPSISYFSPMNMDASLPPHHRRDFSIPYDAPVLVSSNRAIKYENISNESFWTNILSVLDRHKNAYFIPLGLDSTSLPPHPRILKLGFRKDAVRFYSMSDIYIDIFTHTSKGVMEAGYVGIPAITIARPKGGPFSVLHQDLSFDWMPENELTTLDLPTWHSTLDRLILDPSYRRSKGRESYEFTRKFEPRNSVETFLNELESLYRSKINAMQPLYFR